MDEIRLRGMWIWNHEADVFLYVIDKNYEEKVSFPSHLLQLAYADFDLVNCERLI